MNSKKIKVYRDLMQASAVSAEKTRALLKDNNVVMLNLIGSPGCGKTSLLEKTVPAIRDRFRTAILEGDCETTNDAERLGALDAMVSQIITGGACHLGTRIVHDALKDLPLKELDLVIVENVGNLVCPSQFDIGENAKIAVLSVTEGEDKPLKYPMLFREAGAVVVTKTDLLPHLSFDLEKCITHIQEINSGMKIVQFSAVTGNGLDEWVEFLEWNRPGKPVG